MEVVPQPPIIKKRSKRDPIRPSWEIRPGLEMCGCCVRSSEKLCVVHWMMTPKRYVRILTLDICECVLIGKRVLTDLIKDLRMRSHWINQMVSKLWHMHYLQETEAEKAEYRRPCEARGRDGSNSATSQGKLEPPEGGRDREGFSSRAFGESVALPASWFGMLKLPASRTVTENLFQLLCLKSSFVFLI